MIDPENLLWNRLITLKDKPGLVKKMNSADCAWQRTLENLRTAGEGRQVLITGIQNSGKSTLCNLLVGDNDNMTFEIGDREVTLEVKRVRHPKLNMEIVDTPGFGTAAARNAGFEELWANADILIYVSSVLGGSLADQPNVRNSLERILRASPDLVERICIVCTKMADSDNAEEILEKNRKEVTAILGKDGPVFLVDSHWYQDAIKNNDQTLAQVSGVQPFLSWLGRTGDLPSRQHQIFEESKRAWLTELHETRKIVEDMVSESRKRQESLKNGLINSWQTFKLNIRSAWDQCHQYNK